MPMDAQIFDSGEGTSDSLQLLDWVFGRAERIIAAANPPQGTYYDPATGTLRPVAGLTAPMVALDSFGPVLKLGLLLGLGFLLVRAIAR